MSELFPRQVLDRVNSDDDNLTHIVCHDPNRAICGADVTEAKWVPPVDHDDDCLVCTELESNKCPECGM